MNIMYISAEVEPFAKSGGLGDVLGALPKAVAKQGHKVCVVMPKYTQVIAETYQKQMQYIGYIYVDVNWRHQYCGIFKLEDGGVTYYFLDSRFYFGGDLYCFADNERFSFFSKACLDLIAFLQERFEIVHCNDWSSATVPVLFDAFYREKTLYSQIKFVYTIHNLRYQGKMSINEMQDLTGLPDNYFTAEKLVENNAANCMKGGIVFSHAVTTVSPTYAEEIKTDAFSEYLGNVINMHQNKLQGILNGIDYTIYNPAKSKFIAKKYNSKNLESGKLTNKLALQAITGLPQRGEVLTIGLISRLVDQKGLDILDKVMEDLLVCDIQLVVLGTGEKRYEEMFKYYAKRFPDKVSANIAFSNKLAHQIYAGCDLLLVPSAFEPCGLSQLIALKFGTLPLVRETGGLKDTVLSYNEQTGEGNGFSFVAYSADSLWYTLLRAVQMFYDRKTVWNKITAAAVKCSFSWKQSSKKYIELYSKLSGLPKTVKKPEKDSVKASGVKKTGMRSK